jgi:hypothetical protein
MRTLQYEIRDFRFSATRARHNVIDMKNRALSDLKKATILASPTVACPDGIP